MPACNELGFDSDLADVDLESAAQTSVGEEVRVGLVNERYPAAYRNDEYLGAIVSGRPGALVACLKNGEEFVAEVLSVEGAWVQVRVRHA